MPICMWLINKTNMAYCHIDLNGETAVPMTTNDVGLVFGLPHTRRTLNLPRDKTMRRGSLPLMRFKCRWPKVRIRMTSGELLSYFPMPLSWHRQPNWKATMPSGMHQLNPSLSMLIGASFSYTISLMALMTSGNMASPI